MEQWKDIPGKQGYQASNEGNIRNQFGEILKKYNSRGYDTVFVRKGTSFVHRLVARAWCEGYFKGAEVDHKDCIKKNNVSSNLEWVTHRENMSRAFRNGLMKNLNRHKLIIHDEYAIYQIEFHFIRTPQAA